MANSDSARSGINSNSGSAMYMPLSLSLENYSVKKISVFDSSCVESRIYIQVQLALVSTVFFFLNYSKKYRQWLGLVVLRTKMLMNSNER